MSRQKKEKNGNVYDSLLINSQLLSKLKINAHRFLTLTDTQYNTIKGKKARAHACI